MRRLLRFALLAAVLASTSPLAASVVLDWNQACLEAIREEGTAPPVASRALAMVHVAVHDAVSGISGGFAPYHVTRAAPTPASPEAAAAAAAHRVLAEVFPAHLAAWDARLAAHLSTIPDGPPKDAGVSWGSEVGEAILALRADDGASATATHTPPAGSGWWEPALPAYAGPLLPQWPVVTPWAMRTGDQLRPPAPPAPHTREYALAFDEVYWLGGADSPLRSAEQSEIALFWADGPGTATPPGHWHEIAQQLAIQEGLSLPETARLFALLGIAEADAAILAWDAKYWYSHWRPLPAIHAADQDGNPETFPDPGWRPYVATPPFPAYVSGHSTFSGAAARLLALVLGRDDISFATTSNGLPGVTRAFDSLWEAAEEAGQSRIYGGIHWQYDNRLGLDAGRALAEVVFFEHLRPLIAPTPCVPGPAHLCLQGGRFQVGASYRLAGAVQSARAESLTGDSGQFWFFSPDNTELAVKVLDGCALSGHFWVFASGLTDLEVTLAVTDTLSGETKTYFSPASRPMATIVDTEAFAACP
ncbi:MAG: vanadium-dependent haloperoxidase [Thermoanaerobaculia bacterium]|nr:vanadium-dependent haloperoxidase [Thermoanaerobaculia bacterium]